MKRARNDDDVEEDNDFEPDHVDLGSEESDASSEEEDAALLGWDLLMGPYEDDVYDDGGGGRYVGLKESAELRDFRHMQYDLAELKRYALSRFHPSLGSLSWSGVIIDDEQIRSICEEVDWQDARRAWQLFNEWVIAQPGWRDVMLDAALTLSHFSVQKEPRLLLDHRAGFRYLFYVGRKEVSALWYTCKATRRAIEHERGTLMHNLGIYAERERIKAMEERLKAREEARKRRLQEIQQRQQQRMRERWAFYGLHMDAPARPNPDGPQADPTAEGRNPNDT